MDPLRTVKTFAEHCADAVVVMAGKLPRPRIIYVNPAFTRVTGYSASEAVGKTPEILHGPKTDQAELARYRSELRTRGQSRGKIVNYSKQGREILFDWRVARLCEHDESPEHWFCIRRQISPTDRLPTLSVLLLDVDPLVQAGLQRCLGELAEDLTIRQASPEVSSGLPANFDLAIIQAAGRLDVHAARIVRVGRMLSGTRIALIADDDLLRAEFVAPLPANIVALIPRGTEERLVAHILRLVIAGGRYFDTVLRPASASPGPGDTVDRVAPEALTTRQLEILQLLHHGLTNEQIARSLGLSTNTVKGHLTRLFKVLGVESRTQAALR